MKKSALITLIKTIITEASPTGYSFDDFEWLGNMSGFGIPSDVYYGAIYLGTIESDIDGYRLVLVDTPRAKKRVEQSSLNRFKSKNESARVLHLLWKYERRERPELT